MSVLFVCVSGDDEVAFFQDATPNNAAALLNPHYSFTTEALAAVPAVVREEELLCMSGRGMSRKSPTVCSLW